MPQSLGCDMSERRRVPGSKLLRSGGGRGIRTLVTVSRKHAFQACAFSHSATPPQGPGTIIRGTSGASAAVLAVVRRTGLADINRDSLSDAGREIDAPHILLPLDVEDSDAWDNTVAAFAGRPAGGWMCLSTMPASRIRAASTTSRCAPRSGRSTSTWGPRCHRAVHRWRQMIDGIASGRDRQGPGEAMIRQPAANRSRGVDAAAGCGDHME